MLLSCPKGHVYQASTAGADAGCPYCSATVDIPAADASTLEAAAAGAGVSDPRSSAPFAGRIVPGYEILGELGRGGMGVVYKARQTSLNRLVALKMILAADHADPHMLARFRTEAHAVAGLQHPNIVQIHEIGESGGLPYCSLEFVDGGSLEDKIGAKPQSPRLAAEIVEALARAVAYAHQHGIIHRDLKPANVLLGGNLAAFDRQAGRHAERGDAGDKATLSRLNPLTPKITDFGLAKRLDDKVGTTLAGTVMGTPNYMAPEQAMGDRAGPAADQYALGAILYEMLTGRPPFMGATPLDTLRQVVVQEPVPPTRLQPKVPRDLETICLKCLQKEPRRRYADAEALGDDLQRFLVGEPILARPTTIWERGWKWARRSPATAALVVVSAAALALLIGGGIVYNARLRTERDRAEKNFKRAHDAVDQMLTKVAEDRLGSLAFAPRMEESRRQLLERALVFFEEFLLERGDDPEVRFEAARAYQRVGDISRKLGRHDRAQDAYRQAMALFGELSAGASDNHEFRFQAADAQNWLGESLRMSGKPGQARKTYLEALQRTDELVAEFRIKGAYSQLKGRILYNLGILSRDSNRYAEAEKRYAEAVQVFQQLYETDRASPDYRRQLALAHLNRGRVQSVEEMATTYQRAIDLLAGLHAEFPNDPDYQFELGVAYNNRGNALRMGQRYDEAENAHRQAIDHFQQLHRNFPRVPDYRNELANSHNSLGAVLYQLKDPRAAEESWQEARRLFADLVREFSSVTDYQHRLATTLENLGWLHREQGKLKEAVDFLERARQHETAALRDNPANPDYRKGLIRQSEYLIQALLGLGQVEAAIRIAETLPATLGEKGNDYHDAAAALAGGVNRLENSSLPDGERRAAAKKLVDRVVRLVRRSNQKGHRDLEGLKGPSFEAVRSHADFLQLLAELESPAKSAQK